MCRAAVAELDRRGRVASGGLVVAAHDDEIAIERIETTTGDHPVPGARSFDAAARLSRLIDRVQPDDDVLMLLSGATGR